METPAQTPVDIESPPTGEDTFSVTVTKSSVDDKLGIGLTPANIGDFFKVKSIGEGKLLSETDLKEGMIIKSVNGLDLKPSTMNVSEAIAMLKGAEGDVTIEAFTTTKADAAPTPAKTIPESTAVATTAVIASTENSTKSGCSCNCPAYSSLLVAILGFFLFPIIMIPLGLILGGVALNKIDKDPEVGGKCPAYAGLIISFVDLFVFLVFWSL